MISNCLFEAIKAKIKNPQNIRIHVMPISINNGQLHFYWVNIAENRMYHYVLPGCNVFCNPLFNGKLKSMNNIFFEEKMYKKMAKLNWTRECQIKMAKKLGFSITEPFELDRE